MPTHPGPAAPNASAGTVPRIPKLRHHKATGQGYVVIAGKARYLGRFADPGTAQRYHQLIAEWLAAGRQLRVDQHRITIREVAIRFWAHVVAYYRSPRGKPTSEVAAYQASLRFLKQLYANTPAAEFGPLKLKAVREQMIAAGWCRRTVNKRITRVKNVFRWATENELIGGEVLHALQSVAGLRQGRSACPETEPVRPVPLAWVLAVQPHVSRQVWAMVELQLLTAARPGEVVVMRPCDLDTSGRVWTYTPAEHKNAYRGQLRTIYLGPRAQRVIRPFMAHPVDAYLFSPAEAEHERREAQHARRKTPLAWGNRPGTNRSDHPQRPAGDHYTVASYRRAIERGCREAFPLPEHLAPREKETRSTWQARLTADEKIEIRAWYREHAWHPHQLRHNAATELRKEFGLEAARLILGHRTAAVTEIYAELDHAKALAIAQQVG